MQLASKPVSYLYFFLLIKAIFCFLYISGSYLPLNPDEAQYWLWSRFLDYGYYSKPAGIAWQIAGSCYLFGNTELGVRFFSIILSFFTAIAVYKLAFVITRSDKKAALSAFCFALSPLAIAGSILVNTDGAMVLFLTLAFCYMCQFLETNKGLYLSSLCIAVGCLFKFTILLFWPVVFLITFFYKRAVFLSSFKAAIVSLVGLLPSLLWNLRHKFSTFKHVYTQSVGGSNPSDGNFLEFLGAQSGLVGPAIFLILVANFIWGIREFSKRDLSFKLVFTFVYTCLASYMVISIFTKMQANWVIYIYPIYFSFFLVDLSKKASQYTALSIVSSLLSLGLSLMMLSVPYLQQRQEVSDAIPYKFNPFRHHMGWYELETHLDSVGYNPKEHFLFSHKYQMTSLLSFYSKGQKPAYFFNLGNSRMNQFVFWKQMWEVEQGRDGYFIFVENEPHFSKDLESRKAYWHSQLSPYFQEVDLVKSGPLFEVGGKLAKGFLLYKGLNYNGKIPEVKKTYW